MSPRIASIVFWAGIGGLFYLDRDKNSRVSKALWIPAVWLFIISSRALSQWLGMVSLVPNRSADAPSEALVEGSPLDRSLFLILLFVALAVLIARSGRVGPLLRKNPIILLYFLFCAVSISWSVFPFVAFKRWWKALGDLAMVLIILTEAEPWDALKRFLTRLGFLIVPLSVLYIKYVPDIGRIFTRAGDTEPVGVTVQKNELGLDCMIFGVFFVAMLISAYRDRQDPRRRGLLLAYGATIAMVIWLLSQCNSTTSITGLISAGGVMWLASRPKRKLAVVHLSVLAVLGVALFALFFNPGGGMLTAIGKDPTLTGRTEIWAAVLSLHTNPWVGDGFESFWLGPRLKQLWEALGGFPANEAHNGYLEVYLNLGWVGICFIALFILTAYKRIISSIRQNPAKGSLFLGFLLCTLFNAFTENAFRMMTPSWFFLLLVIVAGSHATLFRSSTPAAPVRAGGTEGGEAPEYAAHGASLVSP
jgi:exopolysaccharide production protein ExoQ